jgi:hypothetical protein
MNGQINRHDAYPLGFQETEQGEMTMGSGLQGSQPRHDDGNGQGVVTGPSRLTQSLPLANFSTAILVETNVLSKADSMESSAFPWSYEFIEANRVG